MIRSWIIAAAFISAAAVPYKNWEKTSNGIILKLKNGKEAASGVLKLEVINDEIIHVTISPTGNFSKTESLITVNPLPQGKNFTVKDEKDELVLSTPALSAHVIKSTGRISFTDKNGTLLKEPADNARSFKPVTIEGTNGYTISQVFESPENEAFYGLGQHQSDEFNYKGKNEILYQYNTKVSVPVVISDRNYGLLWDNYSLTRFGNPKEYSDLDLFSLTDKDGKRGALTATYSDRSGSNKVLVRRRESSIDYENLSTISKLPSGIPLSNTDVTWEGTIVPPTTGTYFFKLYYAGYIKLFIDNEQIVAERWRTAWNPNTWKFNRNMTKGKKYNLRVVWKPDGGVSYLGLKALAPVDRVTQGNLHLTSEIGDQIDYYFIHGNNADGVISGYRLLTGKAPIMPQWAMGFWQSRERYKSQDELLNVVKEYRKRNIPLDNIVLDWSYWPVESWGSHEFDKRYFPDPVSMVDQVHKMDARIMISVWPKFYITTAHYREFDEKGWMYHQAVKDSIRDWIGKGYIGSFYDPYSEGARKLFWNQIKEHLYSKGFDAWWMDASEPDIESNASLEYRKLLSTPTALGPSAKYLNTYALMNAMAIYNGQRSADSNKRVFLLTRSGFAGLQRYSTATWSGDIGTRWEDMKAQISAGLNYAVSGIPYWTMDIGGFCVENRYSSAKEGSSDLEEWRELNTRWFQFGAFCPLFRSHGQYPYREIFNLAPEDNPAYKSMVYYDRLRYRLMPYIYSLASMTWFNDYTIMRPLFMDFNSDSKVKSLGDQYMFGPSFLVAPVYRYKDRSRALYLPSGTGWYDFYTGKYIAGGQNISADAPLERIPLFVKEGSVIPTGPAINHTGESPEAPLTILVYQGRDGAFSLYEDNGVDYDYERGKFCRISFSYNEAKRELTIGARQGAYAGMPQKRIFRILFISKENPASVDDSAAGLQSVSYTGESLVVHSDMRAK